MLVTADELKTLLAEGTAVAVDVRPEADWRASTISGAVNLNVYDYFIPESTEAGIAGMAAGAREAFARAVPDGQIPVFFEDHTGMISPRGLWFYELAGFEGGLILDGGYQAWRAAGGDVAPGAGAPVAITQGEAPAQFEFRRDIVASIADVLDHTKKHADIFDVRRRSEFEGTFVHACCARPGRIPDAKFAFFEDMLVDGHYRSPDEIRKLAEDAGLSPDREIITYCHRGARAATALYGLRLAGFDKVRIFTGSWHEWAGDTSLPVDIGPCEGV